MRQSILVGLGVVALPLAAAGTAEAQTQPLAPAPAAARATGRYLSVSVSAISGDKYSYLVEDLFPVKGEIGDGYLLEGAYGMNLAPDWRGEIALSWRDHNNATTSWVFAANRTGPGMSAYTLDVIAYRDFAINSRANFYLGGGVGVANATLDDGVVRDSTASGLQLQAIAGVDAQLAGNVKVFAEARLRSLHPNVQDGAAGAAGAVRDDFDITSTTFGAGVRYMF